MVVWRHSQDIIHQFKQTQNAVLFAAEFCWERCGLSRHMVSSLIIVACPFSCSDPISESGDREQYPTLQDYIGEVIIRYPGKTPARVLDGAIRTETDTCVVSILGHRAAPKNDITEAVLETLPPLHIARKKSKM